MVARGAVRVLQFIFASTVLALSSMLIKNFGLGSCPSLIGYGAFCGGGGLVVAVIGVASIFFEPVEDINILGLDEIATFFLLAGGIAFAVTIKVGDCTNLSYLEAHMNIFGVIKDKSYEANLNNQGLAPYDAYVYRCRMSQADTIIIWLLFAASATALAFSFAKSRTSIN